MAGMICNSSIIPNIDSTVVLSFFYFGKNFMGGYKHRYVDLLYASLLLLVSFQWVCVYIEQMELF